VAAEADRMNGTAPPVSRWTSAYSRVGRRAREGLRKRIIRLDGLSTGARILVVLGYASMAIFLGCVLVFELWGASMPGIRFTFGDEAMFVPVPASLVASAAFAVGWALVLTGATDCRRRVFLPVVFLFLFQLLVLSSAVPAEAILAMWGLALPLVAIPVALRLFTGRFGFWRDYALAEFLFWFAGIFGLVAFAWGYNETLEAVAVGLSAALGVLLLFSMPFWFLLGLDVVDLAIDLARVTVSRIRHSLSQTWFHATAISMLLLHPPLALLAFFAGPESAVWFVLDLPGSLLVAAWALGLMLAGRWTARAAAVLLSASLAWSIVAAGIVVALGGKDFAEFAISAAGAVPPAVLFAALMSYDVLNFGVRFTGVDGRIMPRGGRVLMYFGSSILVTSFALFFLNTREVATGRIDDLLETLVNIPFAFGVLALGPLYMIWVVWRRRERLLGELFSPLPVKASPDPPRKDG
jgi:hypothetical protein